jgi:hypothetical protein
MILIILLIFIGTNNQIYSSDHNLRVQQTDSNLPSSNHHQPVREEESFSSYGSLNDDDNGLHIVRTHYIRTPTPKLYYEYHHDNQNDPYELYMKEKENDPNKCKKAACGTICCSSILSILGCLLLPHI